MELHGGASRVVSGYGRPLVPKLMRKWWKRKLKTLLKTR